MQPVQVNFGEGKILISVFHDDDGHGVILFDSGESHEVGSDGGEVSTVPRDPKENEIYLHFKNQASVGVLMSQLAQVLLSFED